MTAEDVIETMESMLDSDQRTVLMRFFKTAKGEYGEGDEFLGIKTPQTRKVVKECKSLPMSEVPTLLKNKWHEVRLCGLLILVDRFEAACKKKVADTDEATATRDEIVQMYLAHTDFINNWDLVDLTAPKIIGQWLTLKSNLGDDGYKIGTLDNLANSNHLWQQRIAMVSTMWTSAKGNPFFCIRYAEMLMHHKHDLIHKAVGWMLREMGKRCGTDILRDFLRQHIDTMPRTTLRYAIERLSPEERAMWMKM
ncbi:MAG: DNA alkylation repair protein [Bacteroidaceae bacterium]|nr:DNA alkylation repair protein [Bacteroidaceae bacterium]